MLWGTPIVCWKNNKKHLIVVSYCFWHNRQKAYMPAVGYESRLDIKTIAATTNNERAQRNMCLLFRDFKSEL